jgi:CHAP domain
MFPVNSRLSTRHHMPPNRLHPSYPSLLILVLLLSFSLSSLSIHPANANPVAPGNHTFPTINTSCSHVTFSPDGNPFPICPGPFPLTGGNCTWWAWEQWHLLGYNLPVNWGNAADWLVEAERSGLTIGHLPRLGSIAVFPRADGVWAYGPDGHVAFVSNVYPDGQTFDVTYQNYGDPTPLYQGKNYNVSVINQAAFQDGTMNFIYFPQPISLQRFTLLPGIGPFDPLALIHANAALNNLTSSSSDLTGDRLALGLAPSSSDQEFNADFTGTGLSNLLLYNRSAGQLAVLRLDVHRPPGLSLRYAEREPFHEDPPVPEDSLPQLVQLSDSRTHVGAWGSDLEIHIGRFAGTPASDILLYNRVKGTIQLISLNSDLSIQRHVTLPGYGLGWELYVGQFNSQRSSIFLYNRFAVPISQPISNPWPSSLPISTPTPTHVAPSRTHTPTHIRPTHAFASKPTPTTSPTPKPFPTPTLEPSVSPTPLVTPSSTLNSYATPTPIPNLSPTFVVHVQSTALVKRTSTPQPALTPTSTSISTAHTLFTSKTAFLHSHALFAPAQSSPPQTPAFTPPHPISLGGLKDLSGSKLADWEKLGRSANIKLLDFNSNFTIRDQQQYDLWHSSWEVYVGRFASSSQDGIFLFDRLLGAGRILDFDSHLHVNHSQTLHNLGGNWVVYTGNFMGSARAQLLLYDPSSGNARILVFAHDLSLASQKSYSKWGTDKVLYIGHFGTRTLSVMLYDSQHAESTFITFNSSLKIVQQYAVASWNQNWQILIGSFLDRSHCLLQANCSTTDDILVLNHKTGQMEQYSFSFGRTFKLYDNRLQSFERLGLTTDTHLTSLNTSSFSFVSILQTSIKNEELY